MSNARDANREVGRGDVPIEVTISSLNGHMLYIKDNGPGIDPERMATVYTRYGSSTKRGTTSRPGDSDSVRRHPSPTWTPSR